MAPYATLNGSMVVNEAFGMGDEIEDLIRFLVPSQYFTVENEENYATCHRSQSPGEDSTSGPPKYTSDLFSWFDGNSSIRQGFWIITAYHLPIQNLN